MRTALAGWEVFGGFEPAHYGRSACFRGRHRALWLESLEESAGRSGRGGSGGTLRTRTPPLPPGHRADRAAGGEDATGNPDRHRRTGGRGKGAPRGPLRPAPAACSTLWAAGGGEDRRRPTRAGGGETDAGLAVSPRR